MSKSVLCTLLLLLPELALAQNAETRLPPRIVAAELPNYPAIAQAAHITGWLKVQITVEKGLVVRTRVVSTEARDTSHLFKQGLPFLTEPTLSNLKSWRFDSDASGTFVVTYTYNIAGTETDAPTTPKIEVSPSLDVSVTARPVKPTVNY